MAQKVATARKMKSQQENLPRPNCDSDGKANNKQQAFINTDTRSFKIQMGNMGPPPGRASSVAKTAYFGGRVSCNPSTLYIVAAPSFKCPALCFLTLLLTFTVTESQCDGFGAQ